MGTVGILDKQWSPLLSNLVKKFHPLSCVDWTLPKFKASQMDIDTYLQLSSNCQRYCLESTTHLHQTHLSTIILPTGTMSLVHFHSTYVHQSACTPHDGTPHHASTAKWNFNSRKQVKMTRQFETLCPSSSKERTINFVKKRLQTNPS